MFWRDICRPVHRSCVKQTPFGKVLWDFEKGTEEMQVEFTVDALPARWDSGSLKKGSQSQQ